MKLVRFEGAENSGLGVLENDRIRPLSSIVSGLPTTMIELIESWAEWKDVVASAIGPTLPLEQVRLLAPIDNPGKILAIGLNYADHVAETGLATPTDQLWFCKQPSAVNGPFDPIEIPHVSSMVDYEVELVAVIGKAGRHISIDDAPQHVFGYCVGNDVSVRDWQMRTPQWMLGKSFDTHAPFGPWLTTADEVGDPHRLDIACFVNGEPRQRSNTANLVFNVWDQIAHLSAAMTLQPGDLIFTGTPGGVGLAMTPPRFLRDGDLVRCEVERLGGIEGRCVPEK